MKRIALLLLWGAGATAGETARFHHLHLNSMDPAAAIAFYTSKFDCEPARFGPEDAVWAQRSWLLFRKAAGAPPWEPVSAVWHFGWGAEDMQATYQKHLEAGVKFFTPLTDISWLAGRPDFYYAYVEGPDRALVELNTATHHQFGHLHLFSEDPVAAGEWYATHLGIARRFTQEEARFREGVQLAPSTSMTVDNVSLLIYPIQYSRTAYKEYWQPGPAAIAPTAGRVVDHVAFSVDDLPAALERLRAAGVKITGAIAPIPGTSIRSAFLEGPDSIRLELVEGHATKE